MHRRHCLLPLFALLFGSLSACREASTPAPVVPTVLVQAAEPASMAGAGVFSGEVRSRYEADLSFRVGGKLVARPVDVGDRIQGGVLLARLDPSDLQLGVTASQAQVEAAESELALAKAELDRYTALAKDQFVSQAVLDAKQTLHKAAAARLRQARAQSGLAGNQAGYAELKAPREEVVTAVYAEAGQVVAAGQPILRIARPAPLEVLVHVPESRLAEFRAAKEYRVALWADPGQPLTGTLRELAPAADPATRTYAARIQLLSIPEDMRLGMTAEVVLPNVASSAVAVPLGAVIDRGQGAEVWLVGPDNKVARRAVRVAGYTEQHALIAEGVLAGEKVVAVGAHKLAPGQAVRAQAMLDR